MKPETDQLLYNAQSWQSIRTTNSLQQVAVMGLLFFALIVAGLLLIPWQQSITGKGKVSVYSPMNRPQNIESQISGKIVAWKVQEGQLVRAGQPLVQLAETDPKFLSPVQLAQLQQQQLALLARQKATKARIASLQQQVSFITQSQGVALPSATIRVSQANNRIMVNQQNVLAAKKNQQTAQLNLQRVMQLHTQGLRSTRDLELAQLAAVETQARLNQAQTALTLGQQDWSVSQFDQSKVLADTSASISTAQAGLSTAYETLGSTQSDLAKLSVEIAAFQQRLAQRLVVAPKAGRIIKIINEGVGETISEGDTLAVLLPVAKLDPVVLHHTSKISQSTIQPTEDQAVELLVSDNDAPLVAIGRRVRLQFAGWPALQFSGWPSAATGTFGGTVSVIDAIDDGNSRYRIWVQPDWDRISDGQDKSWPSSRFLRPGSQTVGWIMLDTVPLWWELWRQFNNFPPTVNLKEGGESTGKKDGDYGPKDDIKKPKKKK
jgi:membrane fusion protein, adhesin transport system